MVILGKFRNGILPAMLCQRVKNYSSKPLVSKLFYPTGALPKDAKLGDKQGKALSKSYKLMLHNGLIHHASPGNYYLLPLAVRALEKLTRLIDKIMDDIGAQKVDLPNLTPARLWKETGRWESMGPELFKLHDRHNVEYCLAPTHEEAITQLVADLPPLSRKQFPILWYQITKKFRDEKRPKGGLLRGREFLMKDLYSFDTSLENAQETYKIVCDAYERLFEVLGIPCIKANASSGLMGGSLSHEFHVRSDVGEDVLSVCSKCGYAANAELGNDNCINCNTTCETHHGIEVGHTFLLGSKYSKQFNANYQDESGRQSALEMGCFGLGVTRILAAAIEVLSTDEEIRWPSTIAPYSVCIISPKKGSKEAAAQVLAARIHDERENIPNHENDFVLDDRDNLTIGRRLKDARRLGYPYIVIVGKQATEQVPKVELLDSRTNSTRFVTVAELFDMFHGLFAVEKSGHQRGAASIVT